MVVLEDAIAVFSPELASGHGGTYVQFLVDGPGEFAWRLSSNQGSQVVELDGQEFECNCEDGSILVGMGRHTMRFPIVPGSDPGTEVVLENIKYSPREPPKLDSETMPMEYHQWLDAEGYQGDRSPYFDSTGDGISLLMEYALGISPGHRDATAASRFPRIVESSSLRFQHRSETTLIYRLYVSSNLSEWFQVPFLSRATLDERWSEADVQLFEPARYARLHVTVPIPNG